MCRIQRVETADHYQALKALFREYAESLDFDLCFQGFHAELDDICSQYGAPRGGAFLLMAGKDPVGCVGIRMFEPGTGELKRMYIKPHYRGKGFGKHMLDASIRLARELGYQKIRLDTLESMEQAGKLYRAAGFYEILPYRPNPIAGATYYEMYLHQS